MISPIRVLHTNHSIMKRNGVAFSAYNADTEDYYAFLPSDESDSDEENASASRLAAITCDSIEELAAAFASENSIGSSSKVLTHIGSLNGSKTAAIETTQTPKPVKTLAPGCFNLGGDEEFRIAPRLLELYHGRKTQLQDALDGATRDTKMHGEAPFRFAIQQNFVTLVDEKMKSCEKFETSPILMVVDRIEGNAPEKKNLGRRRPVGTDSDESDEQEKDEMMEQDPLYDEQLDEVDEQWVQLNLRGAHTRIHETDAMLCCPCCFVTVCMACKRHATYTNQYRATAAINCRVKRSEILTYASSESSRVPTSLPFHKRQDRSAGSGHETSVTTPGQQIASLLQADEFYAVACSDCGTIVGVYDRHQQYHFFNALPSNC